MLEYLITFTIKNFIILTSLFLVTRYFALYRSVRHEGGIVQTKYQIHWAPEFYSKKEREAAVLIVQERRRQEERQRLRQSSEERDTPPAYSTQDEDDFHVITKLPPRTLPTFTKYLL